jgi:hypothetical protein
MPANNNYGKQKMIKQRKGYMVVAAAVALCSTANRVNAQTVCYVDAFASGGAGTSWTTAFNDLQDALDAAATGQCSDIWVANGTYRPTFRTTPSNPRTATFKLVSGVRLYGGFSGFETSLSQRDPAVNISLLTGDIGTTGVATDNSYHVVFGENISDTTTTFDGFEVIAGNANGSYPHDGGGGIFLVNSDITVANCYFSGNVARFGGAMNNRTSDTVVTATDFENNNSLTGDGGAVYNTIVARPVFTDCIFRNNSASSKGGAMYTYGSTASLRIDNCVFEDNSAGLDGGAMHNDAVSAVITGSLFVDNHATDDAGAVFNFGGTGSITDTDFHNNSAGDEGGAIHNFAGSRPTISGGVFVGNTGASGGGISNSSNSHATITGCTFEQGDAISGGGVFNRNSHSVISYCTFVANTPGFGGGVHNENSDATVTNCGFFGNSAVAGGGMVNTNGSDSLVTNCVFSGNSAAEDGGGMFNNLSNPIVTNCTFFGNTASVAGGGMNNFIASDSPEVTNSIFWNNEDAGGIDESSQIGGNGSPIVTYSCIMAIASFAGNGNISSNPSFVNPNGADQVLGTADDDFQLRSDSSCTDTGLTDALPADTADLDDDGDTDEATPLDYMGEARLAGAAVPVVDIGAYEFSGDSTGGGPTDPADLNLDGDVDLSDFQTFQLCFMTSGDDEDCLSSDFDGDGDVDLVDFGYFQLAFTGAL